MVHINLTTNATLNSSTEEEISTYANLPYVIFTFLIVICGFGLVGNILSMIVVFRNPQLKVASSVFIFNLALADFLFLLSLPFAAVNVLMKDWIFGVVMCKIYFLCFGINLFASVYTLVAMSLDRYIAVCGIRWSGIRTRPNSIACCVIIWIVATLLTLPLLLYAKQINDPDPKCNIVWPRYEDESPSATAFSYYTMTLGFVLPALLITVFYTMILIELRRAQNTSVADQTSTRRRTRKVTIVVFCIVVAFVVCWLPHWCFQAVILASINLNIGQLKLFAGITTIMYNLNSAINPILYGSFSNQFRQGIIKLFTWKEKHVRSKSSTSVPSSRVMSLLHSIHFRQMSSSKKRQHDIDAELTKKTSALTVQLQEQSCLIDSNECVAAKNINRVTLI